MALSWLRWAWTQFVGFWSNLYTYLATVTLDELLPPSLRALINWLLSIIPRSLGLRGDRGDQLSALVVVALFAILSSLVTFGLSGLLIAALYIPVLIHGLLRLIPAYESWWREFRTRLPGYRDQDVPRWSAT